MSRSRAAPPAILKKPRQSRESGPLELRLSLRFCFGDGPGETVCVMQDQRVPMVDGLLKNRDRVLRTFTKLLVRTSLAQPKVARELAPLWPLLAGAARRRGGRS